MSRSRRLLEASPSGHPSAGSTPIALHRPVPRLSHVSTTRQHTTQTWTSDLPILFSTNPQPTTRDFTWDRATPVRFRPDIRRAYSQGKQAPPKPPLKPASTTAPARPPPRREPSYRQPEPRYTPAISSQTRARPNLAGTLGNESQFGRDIDRKMPTGEKQVWMDKCRQLEQAKASAEGQKEKAIKETEVYRSIAESVPGFKERIKNLESIVDEHVKSKALAVTTAKAVVEARFIKQVDELTMKMTTLEERDVSRSNEAKRQKEQYETELLMIRQHSARTSEAETKAKAARASERIGYDDLRKVHSAYEAVFGVLMKVQDRLLYSVKREFYYWAKARQAWMHFLSDHKHLCQSNPSFRVVTQKVMDFATSRESTYSYRHRASTHALHDAVEAETELQIHSHHSRLFTSTLRYEHHDKSTMAIISLASRTKLTLPLSICIETIRRQIRDLDRRDTKASNEVVEKAIAVQLKMLRDSFQMLKKAKSEGGLLQQTSGLTWLLSAPDVEQATWFRADVLKRRFRDLNGTYQVLTRIIQKINSSNALPAILDQIDPYGLKRSLDVLLSRHLELVFQAYRLQETRDGTTQSSVTERARQEIKLQLRSVGQGMPLRRPETNNEPPSGRGSLERSRLPPGRKRMRRGAHEEKVTRTEEDRPGARRATRRTVSTARPIRSRPVVVSNPPLIRNSLSSKRPAEPGILVAPTIQGVQRETPDNGNVKIRFGATRPQHSSARQASFEFELQDHAEIEDKARETPSPDPGTTHRSTVGGEDIIIPQEKETHVALDYQIPAALFRSALIASPNSAGAYWKHTLFRSSKRPNEKIKAFHATRYDQVESVVGNFKDDKVLGFDMEWEISARQGLDKIKENVSVIQIASEDKVALFQLARFHGESVENLMHPALKELLESPDIIKAGVNIGNDFSRLQKWLGIKGQGIFELSHLYKIVKFSENQPTLINKKPAKLADQVKDILYLPLAKGAVRTSAWSKSLSVEQFEYAATDAYAGFRLFDALEARRKAMQPTPPRPALYELGQPLVLGDGRVAPIRPPKPSTAEVTKSPAPAAVAAEEDDEENEVESIEEDQDSSEGLDTDMANLTVGDSTSDSDGSNAESSSFASSSEDEQFTTPDRDLDLLSSADSWITEFHNSDTANPMPSTPSLRAYYLWHHESVSIEDTARLLRDPPLQKSTVASYVLEAIRLQDLPFERDGLSELIKLIPPAAVGRYHRLLAELGPR